MKKLSKLSLNELQTEMPLIDSEEANSLKGGTSEDEMNAALDAGTWTGGYVDGLGYVAAPVACLGGYGSGTTDSKGSYLTYHDFLQSEKTSLSEVAAGELLGPVGAYYSAQYANMRTDTYTDLLDAGYQSSSLLYVNQKNMPNGDIVYQTYNGSTGALIVSYTMNTLGRYHKN